MSWRTSRFPKKIAATRQSPEDGGASVIRMKSLYPREVHEAVPAALSVYLEPDVHRADHQPAERPEVPRGAGTLSRATRMVGAAVLVALALAGCTGDQGGTGGPSATSAPTTSAATSPPDGPASALLAAEPCLDSGSAQVLPASPPGSLAVLEGDPGAGVAVLSNMTTDVLCEWQPLATALRARGVAVLRWDYGTADPQPELARLVAEARRRGAPRVVLVGASVGGAYAVLTGAAVRPVVDGVASISGALPLRSTLRVEPAARRLRAPLLLAGAEVDAGPTVRSWARAAGTARVRTLLVPGLRHGTALLTGAQAPQVLGPVTAWIAARLRG